MPIDKLLVGIGGLGSILFVAWFFFGKKVQEVAVDSQVQIMVDGGYTPEIITVKQGQPVTLNFFRKDASSCLEEVVLPDFGVRKMLALNQTTPIEITPRQAGEFAFSCGMHMYHGKIKVTP
jgi:plastocyanin domain-containing protein